ncbi:hypothetical protein D3C83_260650 [compost metagenome]
MLDRAKGAHRRRDFRVRYADARCRERRRQHVLDIVPSANRNLACRHQQFAADH